jgi:hypothetical protein
MPKTRPRLARLTRPRLHEALACGPVTSEAGRLRGGRYSLATQSFVCGDGRVGPRMRCASGVTLGAFPHTFTNCSAWGRGPATANGDLCNGC